MSAAACAVRRSERVEYSLNAWSTAAVDCGTPADCETLVAPPLLTVLIDDERLEVALDVVPSELAAEPPEKELNCGFVITVIGSGRGAEPVSIY